jgi:hypothetical protein
MKVSAAQALHCLSSVAAGDRDDRWPGPQSRTTLQVS